MTKLKVTAVSSIILYQPILMPDFGPNSKSKKWVIFAYPGGIFLSFHIEMDPTHYEGHPHVRGREYTP